MAVADVDALFATPVSSVVFQKNALNNSVRRGQEFASNLWTTTGSPAGAANPSTAEACDGSTPGAMLIPARTSSMVISRVVPSHGLRDTQPDGPRTYFLMDRLSHQGGLDASLTTTQTTNLPTAALTRYTTGVGVIPLIELFGSLSGTIPVTFTVSYTNQAGTPGRTGTWVYAVALSLATGGMFAINMEGSDTGCRSVESVTLSGTTGTAATFGITLVKPLAIIAAGCTDLEPLTAFNITGWNSLIDPDACLVLVNRYTHQLSLAGNHGMIIDLQDAS